MRNWTVYQWLQKEVYFHLLLKMIHLSKLETMQDRAVHDEFIYCDI